MKKNRRSLGNSRLRQVRWTSYAIAAGATAAGTITPAEAVIHYSGPVHYKFNVKSNFVEQTFQLSAGAFLIGAQNKVPFLGSNYAGFGIFGASASNSLRGPGSVSGLNLLSALRGGSVVSNGPFFRNSCDRCYGVMQNGSCVNPDWQSPGTYFVGFRFNKGSGQQYGWARLRWRGCNRNSFIVQDYAWGDVGDQIKAGQTSSRDEAQGKPEAPAATTEGSLGLLALGAVGLAAWRRSRHAE